MTHYKYGETIELYALLDQAAKGGPAVRLGPKGAADSTTTVIWIMEAK